MKYVIIICVIGLFSCKSTKNAVPENAINESSIELNDSIPSCIKGMINSMQKAPVANPPHKLYSFTYKTKKVYYLPAVCCDMFSDLYDDSCRMMGHPDGGFTGKGDGKFPDFEATKTNEKLLWEDNRK